MRRRFLFGGLATLLAAPAIVQAISIMGVSVVPQPYVFTDIDGFYNPNTDTYTTPDGEVITAVMLMVGGAYWAERLNRFKIPDSNAIIDARHAAGMLGKRRISMAGTIFGGQTSP